MNKFMNKSRKVKRKRDDKEKIDELCEGKGASDSAMADKTK